MFKSLTLLFSEEELVGDLLSPHSSDLRETLSALRRLSSSTKVLLVIRRQSDLLRSLYSEFLKVGGVCSVEEFLNRGRGKFTSLLSYHLVIEDCIEILGAKNIKVITFEELVANPQLMITNIHRFIVPTGVIQPIDLNLQKVNPSLHEISFGLMRLQNRIFYTQMKPRGFKFSIFRLAKKCSVLLSGMLGPSRPKKEIEEFANIFEQSNQKLIGKINLETLKKYKYLR